MGTVYSARQISLDRPAAVKIMRQQYTDDEKYRETFLHEARTAARLNHPGIVQAYAVGEDEGFLYFAMEYVEGTSVKEVLTHSGSIMLARALSIIKQVTVALDFAWTNAQLVHRDIKPDNIMLMEDGTVKLADLGLAKLTTETEEDTDVVFGTPQYISPEQLMGEEVDCRSDIYSLGATFYQLVTGQFPYNASSPAEIGRKHLEEILVPPHEIVPEIPEEVSVMVQIMMAKRPDARYQTPGELLEDIENVEEGRRIRRRLSADSQQLIRNRTTALKAGKKRITLNRSATRRSRGGAAANSTGGRSSARASTGRTAAPARASQSRIGGGGPLPHSQTERLSRRRQQNGRPVKDEPFDKAPAKSKSSVLPWVLLAVAFAIAAGAITLLVVRPFDKENGDQEVVPVPVKPPDNGETPPPEPNGGDNGEQPDGPDNGGEPQPPQPSIVDMVNELLDGGKNEEALAKAQNYFQSPDADPDQTSKLLARIAPLTEAAIRSQREEVANRLTEGWKRQGKQMRDQLARQKQAEERERARKEWLKAQEDTRAEVRALCRAGNYFQAKAKLVKYQASAEPEKKQWGTRLTAMIDAAERTFNLISGTQTQLQGFPLERYPWDAVRGLTQPNIDRIGADSVVIAYREKWYVQGIYRGVRRTTKDVPITELPHTLMAALCKRQYKGDSDDELLLWLGAFFGLSTEETQAAEVYLEKSNHADADAFSKELSFFPKGTPGIEEFE